ncbi:phasin family protein [Emcibacter sp. SYSU 3D8]|uniref:phasin family protein n=1 Tax=Emcibacter sp. SYSU 3D8 TaxID=3133969 RepID=UPI0031FEC502
MATTRTTRSKPATKTATAVSPTAKAAAKPASRAAKPRAKTVKPAPAEPVAPVAATPAAATASPPTVEPVADRVEATATEAPPTADAAAELSQSAELAASAVKDTAVKAVKVGKSAAEKAVKAGSGKITKTIGQAVATSKEKYGTAMQNISDISAIGRENMDAVVSAGTVFAKGIEAVNAEIAAISKRNVEDSVAAVKALAAAKSPKEYFELQTDMMKTSWDHMVADTTKIGEMLGEYSKDAMAPIQSRLSAAMEKLSKPLAL